MNMNDVKKRHLLYSSLHCRHVQLVVFYHSQAELQLAIALSRHLEKRLQLIEALNEVLEMAAPASNCWEELTICCSRCI